MLQSAPYGFYSPENAEKYGYVVHLSDKGIPVPVTRVSLSDSDNHPTPGESMVLLRNNSYLATFPPESPSPHPSPTWYDDCY